MLTLRGYRVKAQSGVNNVTSMNTTQFIVIVQKGYRISKSITAWFLATDIIILLKSSLKPP